MLSFSPTQSRTKSKITVHHRTNPPPSQSPSRSRRINHPHSYYSYKALVCSKPACSKEFKLRQLSPSTETFSKCHWIEYLSRPQTILHVLQSKATTSSFMFHLSYKEITLACSKATITSITVHFKDNSKRNLIHLSSSLRPSKIPSSYLQATVHSNRFMFHISCFIFKTTPYPTFNWIESNLILSWVTQSALNPPLDSINIVDVYQWQMSRRLGYKQVEASGILRC